MTYVLLDRPNPHGDHFYRSRRQKVKAIVVHITAGLEDLDTVDDHSAERTADYAATTDRKVSWHSGSDTDTCILLLPASFTAFHCQGYNSTTVGHEISKNHTDWSTMDPLWVKATLERAADCLRPVAAELAIPARKATKDELDTAIALDGPPVGFIGHRELDPNRRSDPGLVRGVDTFPWQRLLDLLAPPLQEDDDMRKAWIMKGSGDDLFLVSGDLQHKRKIWTDNELADLKTLASESGLELINGGVVREVSQALLDRIPTLETKP